MLAAARRQPARRLAAAGVDHPRRRARLLPADGAADRDPLARARVHRAGVPRQLDAGRRRAGGDRAATRRAVRSARAGVRRVLRVLFRARSRSAQCHARGRQRARARRRPVGDGAGARACWRSRATRRCWRSTARPPRARANSSPRLRCSSGSRSSRPPAGRSSSGSPPPPPRCGSTPATAIVREGEPADYLYVLVEGEVEVSARGEARRPRAEDQGDDRPHLLRRDRRARGDPADRHGHGADRVRLRRIDGDTLLDALTASPPSSSLMENARGRLAVTHPARKVTFGAPPEQATLS